MAQHGVISAAPSLIIDCAVSQLKHNGRSAVECSVATCKAAMITKSQVYNIQLVGSWRVRRPQEEVLWLDITVHIPAQATAHQQAYSTLHNQFWVMHVLPARAFRLGYCIDRLGHGWWNSTGMAWTLGLKRRVKLLGKLKNSERLLAACSPLLM